MSASLRPLRHAPRLALGHLRRRRVVGASLGLVAARRARAQAPWPDRPVRLIAALPAGSGLDLLGRALAPFLARRFGQPFIVENRPGAGGIIAATAVAQATDGHTFGLVVGGPTTTARVINPRLAYDPARDFTAISLIYRTPFLFCVPAASPLRSLSDLVATAQARPGALAYGSIGPGTVTHLAMEELAHRHGIYLEHAVYRGFPEMTLDIAAGRIDCALNTTFGALPAVQDGRVRALAVTSDRRSALFPEAPTVGEAGGPGATCFGWTGLVGPAGMPPGRAEAIAATIREAVATPEGRANLDRQGGEFVAGTPQDFARIKGEETARWTAVIERLGLRVAN